MVKMLTVRTELGGALTTSFLVTCCLDLTSLATSFNLTSPLLLSLTSSTIFGDFNADMRIRQMKERWQKVCVCVCELVCVNKCVGVCVS